MRLSKLLLATWLMLPTSVLAGSLQITVANVRSGDGNVIVALHREGDTFPDATSPYLGGFRRAKGGAVTLTFVDLPPGRYAIAVAHDENANHRLDRRFLGIPKEGFGFSNNVVGLIGPPSFADAAIAVEAGQATKQTIRMRYMTSASNDTAS